MRQVLHFQQDPQWYCWCQKNIFQHSNVIIINPNDFSVLEFSHVNHKWSMKNIIIFFRQKSIPQRGFLGNEIKVCRREKSLLVYLSHLQIIQKLYIFRLSKKQKMSKNGINIILLKHRHVISHGYKINFNFY